MKNLLTTLMILLFITSCGGGSSGGDDTSDVSTTIDASQYYYQPIPGDIITFTNHWVLGQNQELTIIQENNYSQVNDIPSKYSYSGTLSGPYLLESTEENGETTGSQYYSLQGDDIIDDDLETFANVDHSTYSGTETPESVSLGQEYSFHNEEELFSSVTGVNVGNRSIEGTIEPIQIETITVSAGTYESLKFEATSTLTETIDSTITTYSSSGYIWYGKNIGVIKYTATITQTSDSATTTSSYTSELSSVNLASSSAIIGSMVLSSELRQNIFINNFYREYDHIKIVSQK